MKTTNDGYDFPFEDTSPPGSIPFDQEDAEPITDEEMREIMEILAPLADKNGDVRIEIPFSIGKRCVVEQKPTRKIRYDKVVVEKI